MLISESNGLENGKQMYSGEEASGGLHDKMMDFELLDTSFVDAFSFENENQIAHERNEWQ